MRLQKKFKESQTSAFWIDLREWFDDATADKVCAIFSKLQLPLPNPRSYIEAYYGCCVFDEIHGVVIRVETTHIKHEFPSTHVNRINNPWILQPLRSLAAKKAIVEICPGVFVSDNSITAPEGTTDAKFLFGQLKKYNIEYWDDTDANSGRLPFKTPTFPMGVPVVIDRTGVGKLSKSIKPVKTALQKYAQEQSAQKMLYGPLRQQLLDAWPKDGEPDPEKIKAFWETCRDYVRDGKLIAGWKTAPRDGYKTDRAKNAGACYREQLQP